MKIMVIKTKFKIGDLVKFKYDNSAPRKAHGLDIKEIQTQTCYKDTQIFYLCRLLFAEFKEDYCEEKKDVVKTWVVAHGVHNDKDNMSGWKKYREDELIPLDKLTLSIFI